MEKYFKVYEEFYKSMSTMNFEQIGQIFLGLCTYYFDGYLPPYEDSTIYGIIRLMLMYEDFSDEGENNQCEI